MVLQPEKIGASTSLAVLNGYRTNKTCSLQPADTGVVLHGRPECAYAHCRGTRISTLVADLVSKDYCEPRPRKPISIIRATIAAREETRSFAKIRRR